MKWNVLQFLRDLLKSEYFFNSEASWNELSTGRPPAPFICLLPMYWPSDAVTTWDRRDMWSWLIARRDMTLPCLALHSHQSHSDNFIYLLSSLNVISSPAHHDTKDGDKGLPEAAFCSTLHVISCNTNLILLFLFLHWMEPDALKVLYDVRVNRKWRDILIACTEA